MPSVIDLVLKYISTDNQLDLLTRCAGIQRFVSRSRHVPWHEHTQPTLIDTPNLRFMDIDGEPWSLLRYLNCPTIRRVNISTAFPYSVPPQDMSRGLERLITAIAGGTYAESRIQHFSLTWGHSGLSLVGRDTTGGELLTIELIHDMWLSFDNITAFLSQLFKITEPLGIGIASFESSGERRSIDLYLIDYLRKHPHITTLRLFGVTGFDDVLSHLVQKHLQCPMFGQEDRTICFCSLCRHRRVTSHQGLELLILDSIKGDMVLWGSFKWTEVIPLWLEERKAVGLKLDTLRLLHCSLGRVAFERLRQVVFNLILDSSDVVDV
ncbi:hypothetical protein AX16_010143 [Volvariella volvacea WC 439]|nr:hypothetical protein AX16_010143 [Volvariella volvacea WC 439]